MIWTDLSAQGIAQRSLLSGTWGGLRDKLGESGIMFSFNYTGEGFFNLSGGIKQGGTYLQSIDMILALDTRKLLSWKGGTIFLYGMANNGGKPSSFTGDAQGVSNIEAYSTIKLYEAWIQQDLFNNRLSLLAGFYDLNSEFQKLQSSSLFISSPQGVGTLLGQSGLNGPSIFPTTTLGFRIKLQLSRRFYFQTLVLNGLAGNPNNQNGTQLILDGENGILSTSEIQYIIRTNGERNVIHGRKLKNRLGRMVDSGHIGKFALGAWYYTASFPEIVHISSPAGVNMIRGNAGAYFIGELKTFNEAAHPEQGLTAFIRLGLDNSRINRFEAFTGGGLVYLGLIPGRDADETGLAFAIASNGNSYKTMQESEHQSVTQAEWILEFTYQWIAFPWLNLQPDIQYIINPDTNPLVKNAFAFDLRASIAF